jgi:electron transport complex protein RnfA
MPNLIAILLAGMLTDNYVLSRSVGICPFLGVSKKFQQALGMSLAVIFVILFATAATWPIYTYLLVKFELTYLKTIVFILVIAALVQFVEIILKRFIPPLYKSLGVYLPLITTNCIVLGITEENIKAVPARDFLTSMTASLGVGIGFLIAMVLFAGVRSRIENCPAPKSSKGIPITLVAAAIVALAFSGFKSIGV